MNPKTLFAPAKMASAQEVQSQVALIDRHPHLKELYESVTEIIVILNQERQVVFANGNCLNLLGVADPAELYGCRPGSLMDCIHAHETEGGCGTTEFCRKCGAVNAILNAQKGTPDIQECRILQKMSGDALDLLVKTTPLELEGASFCVVAITDISDDKRRRVLERIFFHDIMNTASGIKGLADLLEETEGDLLDEFHQLLAESASDLIDEIQAQRELTAAENDDLSANFTTEDSSEIAAAIKSVYEVHPVGKGRSIEMVEPFAQVQFETDSVLVSRVLGNMLKNALEACPDGGTVRVGVEEVEDDVVFSVHNPTYMPRDVQLQLFQRSFSTKGSGRGIGTYSMKLLSERYLQGSVSFESTEGAGTTFFARYPKKADTSR